MNNKIEMAITDAIMALSGYRDSLQDSIKKLEELDDERSADDEEELDSLVQICEKADAAIEALKEVE